MKRILSIPGITLFFFQNSITIISQIISCICLITPTRKKKTRIIYTLFFSLLTIFSFGQKSNTFEKPKVDERVEILSIVFRLAECKEYSSEKFKLYTDKIQAYYSPYKNHELISFVRKLRKENNVSHDAVMSMAIHLDNNLNPLVKFTDKIPDQHWGKDNAYEFVRLLKKFCVESNSKKFFIENQKLYNEVSEKFLPVYEHLDMAWYTSFYGKEPNEKFIVVNGLGNGGGNFGPSIAFPNGKRTVYAIMGTWEVDSLGMAKFTLGKYFPTLVHEFNHSFVNDLLDKNPEPFRKSGEKIYQSVENEMNNQAYGNWQTMLNEALVRAAVIKYMKDHKFTEQEIQDEINKQLNRGFLWIEELEAELENYDRQRNIYPTLESYFPKIVKAYETYAENRNSYLVKFDEKRPKITSIKEFTNGAENIDASLTQVTINFDRPLLGKGHSINYGDSEETFPDIKEVNYSADKKSIILDWKLESNKVYNFVLSGIAIKSQNGIAIKDYVISFKTK